MAKYMIIDGLRAEFTDEKNILQVIRKVGINIPTFCYSSELSIFGACRMCVVEDERGSIIASCSTPPKDGMKIQGSISAWRIPCTEQPGRLQSIRVRCD